MNECTDPDLGRMIGRYEFGFLTPDEKIQFEKHVAECDACFQNLQFFRPVVKVIKEHPNEFRNVLHDESRIVHIYHLIFSEKNVRWALAAAASAMIIIFSYRLLFRMHQSNQMVIIKDEPRILTPHEPDTQSLKGEIEYTESEMNRSLLQSMYFQISHSGQEVTLHWENVPGTRISALIWMDMERQDTVFSARLKNDTVYQFPLKNVNMNRTYEWHLKGISDSGRPIEVKKGIRLK